MFVEFIYRIRKRLGRMKNSITRNFIYIILLSTYEF